MIVFIFIFVSKFIHFMFMLLMSLEHVFVKLLTQLNSMQCADGHYECNRAQVNDRES
jgi:hypothetical protein